MVYSTKHADSIKAQKRKYESAYQIVKSVSKLIIKCEVYVIKQLTRAV